MSRKAELSENLLAAKLEGLFVWLYERRVQSLISLGVLVAAALIGSVFVLRQREQAVDFQTKIAFAQSMISQRQYPQADTVLAEVRAGSAGNDTTRMATYLSGVSAFEQRKIDEAVTFFSTAVDQSAGHPLRPLARASLGSALEEKKNYEAAIANYAAFISETPDHFLSPRIQLALGRSNLLAGKNDDAKKALDHLIDQFPTSEWAENARRLMDKNKSR